jgi:hypothetical protein
MDYPISAVERIMKAVGRPVTRHWLQQLKKRMRLWGTDYPVIEGRGRYGDRFSPIIICQIALHYDLARQLEQRQAVWSRIAFNEMTRLMFTKAVEYAEKATDDSVNALWLMREGKSDRIPQYQYMGLVVTFDSKWDIDFDWVWSKEHFDKLRERMEDSRAVFIFNLSSIAWEVARAIKEQV